MTNKTIKVLHYINQFFGGIGSEEAANHPIEIRDGAVGPGLALNKSFSNDIEVIGTIIAGDNYYNEEIDHSNKVVLEALEKYKPDLLIAGPAFNAGRYGVACSEVSFLANSIGIPSVTSMFHENPGTLTHRKDIYIIPSSEGVGGMSNALNGIVKLGKKLYLKNEIGPASEEGYLPRGIRKSGKRSAIGADRAVEMLISKVNNIPYETELPIELPEKIIPAPPMKTLSSSKIGLVTSGGLVPMGNPDKLAGGPSQSWFKYDISKLNSMNEGEWESVHVGFFTDITNKNPNYILPLNIVREFEKNGEIGSIHSEYFSTSGRGTPVADSKRMGREMAHDLKSANVDAVIMVAT
jgi:glycine reductase